MLGGVSIRQLGGTTVPRGLAIAGGAAGNCGHLNRFSVGYCWCLFFDQAGSAFRTAAKAVY